MKMHADAPSIPHLLFLFLILTSIEQNLIDRVDW